MDRSLFFLIWSDALSFISRGVLSLRYQVKVKGLPIKGPSDQKKGVLYLCNHVSLVDPLIFAWLWPKFRMRPLTVDFIYQLPLLKSFMKKIGAVPIPDFDTSVNQLKIKKANEAIQTVIQGLQEGGRFILFPAGHLKGSGKEVLGGASSAHAIISQCPDVDIVMIRLTGFWGSSFSKAQLGFSPDLGQEVLHGIKTILRNLIFFSPRRKMTFELEANPVGFPRHSSRLELNRYLENWFNRYPDGKGGIVECEPLQLVPYSIWNKKLPTLTQPQKKSQSGECPISEETNRKVCQEIRRILENPSLQIKPEMSLAFDLGMDSLNTADLSSFLLKNYDIEDFGPESLETVQNALEIAEGAKSDASIPKPNAALPHWPSEKNRLDPISPTGKTIPHSFLNISERMGEFPAFGDDFSGVLSFKKVRQAVLVLAQYFRTFPEKNVAILMPASAGAYITILALQFAGKVPVMLNWTLGPRYLEEMMKISNAKRVLTSSRFIDRLSHINFGTTVDQMVFLEDIRKNLSLKMKLSGLFLAKLPARAIIRFLNLQKGDPAVILFTSGTESTPKCVPLSQENILSNMRSLFAAFETVIPNDCLYSILPPFHSFGFTITGLFPLLCGAKTAFYPDPTNGLALAEGIARWKITILAAPPSFLKRLFSAAKKEQLQGVRVFCSGAEKAPPEILQYIESLGSGAKFLEGYGVTECSPCVTTNRPSIPPKGVGRLLLDYELCTIHPETLEVLPQEAEGEICLRGPSVFSGYIGSARSPFIEIRGENWYRTGDIGYMDKEGTLFISGRLKRFTKLAGEMISLGAIEEELIKELVNRGQISLDTPSLAVCADERIAGKSQLVLFSVVPIEKEVINEILKNAGFSNLIKISRVKKVDEIPVMATGKMDYRRLQAFLD